MLRRIELDLAVFGGNSIVGEAVVFAERGLDDQEEGGEGFIREEPVGAGHGDGCGREEEQLVHSLEQENVRIKMNDSVVVCFTEG